MSELTLPPEQSLAEDTRDDIEALEEVVIGDHVKQQVLVDAGDSEAIARRLGQQAQASATYPAEETDAENIASGVGGEEGTPVESIFDIDQRLIEEREEAEAARVAEIEAEGAASAKANEESKSLAQQTMDAHKKAVGDEEDKLPSTHADLDALAAEENVDLSDATTVAEKQEAIAEARGR
jgi:hypothetical protein